MAQGQAEDSSIREQRHSVRLPPPVSAFAARRATKNPFVDSTNTDRGVPDRDSRPHPAIGKNVKDVPPPPKRQRLKYDQKGSSRHLDSQQLSDSQRNLSFGTAPDVGQVDRRLWKTCRAHVNDTNNDISTHDRKDIDRQELKPEFREDDVDTEYGTDVEDNRDNVSGTDSECGPILQGQRPNQLLSTFAPNKDKVLGETSIQWTVKLDGDDILCMIGQYDIWVRKGVISILGAMLHPSSRLHRVYAPSTQSLPYIRPVPNPYGSANQATELTIITCSSGIRALRHLSPKFGRIWNAKLAHDVAVLGSIDRSRRSYAFLKSSAEDRHQRPLRRLQSYGDRQQLITHLLTIESSTARAMFVCGPKNSGKSTFCRRLVNATLSRPQKNTSASGIASTNYVAFLDLDPGQPEYSPPGELSLILLRAHNLGPPFTHPMVTCSNGGGLIRAHHIGSISPKDNPRHYVKCALDLLNRYRRLLTRYPTCHLVVNSAGWVVDIGLEVLLDIVKSHVISDIIYTSTSGPSDVVELLREAAEPHGARVHFVGSHQSLFTTRIARDFRLMQTLSYLHLDEPEAGFTRWDPRPLTEKVPLTVHWAGDKQAIFAIMDLADGGDPEDLLSVLDGRIVGIVVIEDDTAIPGVKMAATADEAATTVEPQPGADHEFARPDLFAVARMESSEDSGSDNESVATSRSSFQPSKRNNVKATAAATETRHGTSHLTHPSVARNSFDVPYIISDRGSNRPLDPSKSYSIGQALIREANVRTKSLHLLTPVPSEVLQTLHRQKRKIVLVHGKLETPIWAYEEEWERGAALRQQLRREKPEEQAIFDAVDRQEFGHLTPHLSIPKSSEVKSASGDVWSTHREVDVYESDYNDTE